MNSKSFPLLSKSGDTLAGFGLSLLQSLFAEPAVKPWPRRVCLVLLAFAGLAHWLWFFHGPLALDFEDWPKERVYLELLREAVATRTAPLHMDINLQMTQRFLALPETMIAPHVVLLPWLTDQQFITFQSCFMFLLGLGGCWALARRFAWNAFALAIFTLVFSFNGFITCRLACGHFMWAGYYLFPWMLLATIRLLEDPERLRGWIELAWVVLALFLVGSFHLAVWWMLFLGVLALIRPRLLLPIGVALALAGLLCLFRIAPAAITFGGLERDFGTGYPDFLSLGRALVVSLGYDTPALQTPHILLGWWEFNHFVGLPAALFVLVYALKNSATDSVAAPAPYSGSRLFASSSPLPPILPASLRSPLLIAAGVLAIFSLSKFYAPIASLPLPLFNSERVTTRFISVAFFVALFLACSRFSRESARFSPAWQALAVGLLMQTAIELAMHSATWRPLALEATHGPSSYWENAATMAARIAHFPQENKYKFIVAGTWAFSALTLAGSAFAWLRLRPAPPIRLPA